MIMKLQLQPERSPISFSLSSNTAVAVAAADLFSRSFRDYDNLKFKTSLTCIAKARLSSFDGMLCNLGTIDRPGKNR